MAPGTISIGGGSVSEQFSSSVDQFRHRDRSGSSPSGNRSTVREHSLSEKSSNTLVKQNGEEWSEQSSAGDYQRENQIIESAGEKERWKLIGSVDAGGGRVEKSITLDAGQEIRLQAHSLTLGLEGFYVDVKPHPLNELGELASTADALKVVVPPIGRFDAIYQLADDGIMRRSFTAGFGTGMSLDFQAPYENANGFRWFIKIPPQEQIHQNSAGYRIDIYGR